MKQVVQNLKSGEMRLAEVPIPQAGPGRVLVRNAFSLVSAGTERAMVSLARSSMLGKARQRPDLVRQVINKARQEGLASTYQKAMGRLDTLSPLGYSCAGTVIALGVGVADLQVGDRVACAGAGFANHAEIVSVPRNLVAMVPEAARLEDAAFTTLGAIALQGVRQARPTLGESVAVIGLGLVGQLTAQLLKANGCIVLGMDLDAGRCALAGRLGCDAVADSDDALAALVSERTKGVGADAVLIAASTKSNGPVQLAAEVSRDRGRVVAVGLVGLEVPRRPFYDKELDLRLSRSYGPGRYDPNYEEGGQDYPIGYVRWTEGRNMAAFLDLLANGRVDVSPLISHRFAIDDSDKAYALITGEDARKAMGVVLQYGESESVADRTRVALSTDRRSPVASSTPLRIGLIGAGMFAQGTLVPALGRVQDVSLRAVCSASGLSARHVAEKAGAAYCCSETRELLGDSDLDALLVATRHGSHADLVMAAIESGKPVFVEKPLCVSSLQLDAIEQTYKKALENGLAPLVQVGFNRRFAPLAQEMWAFLEGAGPLVMTYRVNAGAVPPDSWLNDPEMGGGRIIGEACHFIDLMQFLCGADPIRVMAMAMEDRGASPRQDNVVTQVAFGDGSVGSLQYVSGGDKAFGKERIEAIGSGRVVALDDFTRLELVRGGRRRVRRRLGQDKGHAAELEAFVSAVRSGGPAPIAFHSQVMTTRATFAAIDSLQSGQPVDLQV